MSGVPQGHCEELKMHLEPLRSITTAVCAPFLFVSALGAQVSVDFQVLKEWQGGYTADVLLEVPLGEGALDGWSISWLGTPEVGNAWNCIVSEDGERTVFSNTANNGNLLPGESTLMGFVGVGSWPPDPSDVRVNDTLVVVKIDGERVDGGGDPPNPCPGDLNADDVIDGMDLAIMLAAWSSADTDADLDGSGIVDGADLTILLGGWGECFPDDGGSGEDGDGFHVEWKPRSPEPFVDAGVGWPSGEAQAVEVSVSAEEALRQIPPTIFGNNVAVWTWDQYYFNPTALQRLRDVQVPLLRYPGGSTSNHYHWDQDYPPEASQHDWLAEDWTTSFPEYIQLLEAVGGARPILTVNYGYVHYGSVERAAEHAANWVEYCNAPNDGSNPGGGVDWAARRASDGWSEPLGFRYWEIGNEIYGNWEIGHEPDGAIYAANWNVIRDAMKAVDPGIMVGLIATDKGWHIPGWSEAAFAHLAPEGVPTGDKADFLIVHDYFYFGDPPVEDILPLAVQIRENKEYLDSLLLTYTNRTPGEVPYAMTEYNTTLYDQVSTPNYLVGGLFIAKVLGELCTQGWDAGNFWDVANGWNSAGQGDHGMLAQGHPGIDEFTPYSAFYAFLLYAKGFGDTLVASSSSDTEVVAYASTFDSGEIGLVLVNESDQPRQVSITASDATLSGEVQAWILSGEALDSGRLTLNGVGTTGDYGGPDPADAPAYATIVANGQSPEITVPAHSVCALVLH